MIRITIIADRVEELRHLLSQSLEWQHIFVPASKPVLFDDIKDIQFPAGSYKPRHQKEDRSR